jgi:hypothetical protein
MSIGLKETDKYIITCASSFFSPPFSSRAFSFSQMRSLLLEKIRKFAPQIIIYFSKNNFEVLTLNNFYIFLQQNIAISFIFNT